MWKSAELTFQQRRRSGRLQHVSDHQERVHGLLHGQPPGHSEPPLASPSPASRITFRRKAEVSQQGDAAMEHIVCRAEAGADDGIATSAGHECDEPCRRREVSGVLVSSFRWAYCQGGFACGDWSTVMFFGAFTSWSPVPQAARVCGEVRVGAAPRISGPVTAQRLVPLYCHGGKLERPGQLALTRLTAPVTR